MKVNLADVEQKDFDPIPAGRYHFKITDGEIREAGPQAKNPGSEYVNWELTVQEGEFTDRKVWTNTSFLANSLWRVQQLLAATGKYTEDQLSGELDFEIEDLIGCDVIADVKLKPETSEYSASNDIKKFLPVGTELKAGASAGSGSLLP